MEKQKRNAKIYASRVARNKTYKELGKEYGLSLQRIKAICDAEKVRVGHNEKEAAQ